MVRKQNEQSAEPQETLDISSPQEEAASLPKDTTTVPESTDDKPKATGNGRVRNGFALVIAVIVVLLIAVTVPALWLKTTLVDTDQWVATVAPLADSPAIQKAISTNVSSTIIDALDMQGIAEEYLPEKALPLAAPIISAMESMIEQQTDSLVASSQFSALWSTISRSGHTALIAVLSGSDNGGALSSANGAITLDTGVVIDAVKQALVDRGFSFVADIPTGYLNGKIVLYSSPLLTQAQTTFSFLQTGTSVLMLLTIVLAVVAVALGKNRRKVILWMGMGTFIVMLVSVLAINLAETPLINSLTSFGTTEKAAATAAYDLILSSLVQEQRIVAFVGLLIGIVTIIIGLPIIRTRLDKSLSHMTAQSKFGRFCRWVDTKQRGCFASGFIAAGVILLLPFSVTWSFLIGLVIALIIWLIIISCIVYLAHFTDDTQGTNRNQESTTPEIAANNQIENPQ